MTRQSCRAARSVRAHRSGMRRSCSSRRPVPATTPNRRPFESRRAKSSNTHRREAVPSRRAASIMVELVPVSQERARHPRKPNRRGQRDRARANLDSRDPQHRSADRRLRQRGRRTHGRPGDSRPVAPRAGALRRRHAALAVRPEADRRGAGVRARRARRPRRPGGQGARDRLQHRERGDAAGCPRALRGRVRHPGH